ncbi:TetR/AcrR family transcriptional regulator [Prescottella equi]|uniref:TetR family transcriptional regulator n=1 Tax=Rhodococcus hoagii TaxID=43767 RepID=A0AAP2AQQ8_RHOHA|nr:TetR family transcriptional regulator C-terminal domain-containing protein [Prescottella equi]AVP70481.1 TetR/AcrR family transcriptional regulator [Prescottella equi]MBM4525820.1 TetR family transcriptional regulator [Prescottella equi]MBM4589124.1 TetR family transcriptional regulator [Prescottella equi]MBM4629322.1 TetR family transcriptional regulator [Prescottella equi]MBM4637751.1 TetR family transcriptional regulator [Prescottella equi]
MPKVVDPQARRDALSRALWKVVQRDGIGAVSVRSVAAEANCSPSALRHYFPNSEDMLAEALSLARAQQRRRIDSMVVSATPHQHVKQLWREALPLTEESRLEAQVWLAVQVAIKTTRVAEVLDSIDAELDHLCEWTATVLAPASAPAVTGAEIRAFTDGLTMNAVLRPRTFSFDQVAVLFDSYLARLQ